MRIVIIGWPGTGKTTLAAELGAEFGVTPRSTDELMNLDWSEASRRASFWFDEPGPWIIEGVAAPRALRKWKERNPGSPPPVDRVIRLTKLYRTLSPGATTMGKGVDKVLAEIMPWLQQASIVEIRKS